MHSGGETAKIGNPCRNPVRKMCRRRRRTISDECASSCLGASYGPYGPFFVPEKRGCKCSPHGAKRNAGRSSPVLPDYASLHLGCAGSSLSLPFAVGKPALGGLGAKPPIQMAVPKALLLFFLCAHAQIDGIVF